MLLADQFSPEKAWGPRALLLKASWGHLGVLVSFPRSVLYASLKSSKYLHKALRKYCKVLQYLEAKQNLASAPHGLQHVNWDDDFSCLLLAAGLYAQ